MAMASTLQLGPGDARSPRRGPGPVPGANLVYFPDQKFGFVVLANWDYTPVEGFAEDIIEIYLPAAAALLLRR